MAAMENRLRKFATFTYLAGAGCVFLFLSTYLHGWASVTKLPPEAKTHLMTDDFKEISRVKDLPASLLAEFAEIAQNPNLQMANPDEKFQETDVIYEKRAAITSIALERALIKLLRDPL